MICSSAIRRTPHGLYVFWRRSTRRSSRGLGVRESAFRLADATGCKICAIVNPRAGGWKRLSLQARRTDHADLVASWLAPDDPDSIKVLIMAGPNDGASLTRIALEAGYDTIVAVGGDGTLNDVIQEL